MSQQRSSQQQSSIDPPDQQRLPQQRLSIDLPGSTAIVLNSDHRLTPPGGTVITSTAIASTAIVNQPPLTDFNFRIFNILILLCKMVKILDVSLNE